MEKFIKDRMPKKLLSDAMISIGVNGEGGETHKIFWVPFKKPDEILTWFRKSYENYLASYDFVGTIEKLYICIAKANEKMVGQGSAMRRIETANKVWKVISQKTKTNC